jgi:hypothetical protein
MEGEGDGGREERAKLEERMAAIEADLDKACQEEDYDKAGESAILPTAMILLLSPLPIINS